MAAFTTRGGADEGAGGARARSLAVGLVGAVLMLAGGVVSGLTASSRTTWSDGDIVVARSSAERFVSVGGMLRPLLNTASGRLLPAPESGDHVALIDEAILARAPRGEPIGIPGAPDVLPASTSLVPTGWLACLDGASVRTRISSTAPPTATSATAPPAAAPDEVAVTVAVDGRAGAVQLVTGDHRYPIPAASSPAVTQYLGQTQPPRRASSAWVELFPAGTALAFDSFGFPPSSAPGRPTPAAVDTDDPMTTIGQLVTNLDHAAEGEQSFVVVADGTVSLTSFAASVYRATAPADLGRAVAVTDADLARLPPSSVAGFFPPDWPAERPRAGSWAGSGVATSGVSGGPPVERAVCAVLDAGRGRPPVTRLRLISPPPSTATGSGTTRTSAAPPSRPTATPIVATASNAPAVPAPEVDGDGGAVVEVGTGPDDATTVYLVDGAGRAYPIVDSPSDTLARLGYRGVVPSRLTAAWIALCPPGPVLGVAAAQSAAGSPASR
ncbi:MAG: type VII secretion protein EccB [Lapillicoccus sp.]